MAGKVWIWVLSCFFVCAFSNPLTLRDCIKTALKNNPQIVSASGSVQKGRGAYRSARSGFFPQLSLQSQAQKSLGSASAPAPGTGTLSASDNYSAYLSAQQMIFDFGKTSAKSSSFGLEWEAAAGDSQSLIQNVVLNTVSAYYSYLQAQAVMEVSQEAYNQAQSHLEQAKILLESGRGVKFDVVKAEVDCANARLNLSRNNNIAETSRIQLENAMGAKIAASDSIRDSVTFVPEKIAEDSALPVALKTRPEAKAARLRALASQRQLSFASRSRYPALLASGAYGYRASNINDPWTHYWNVGLNLSLPLFAGGAIKGAVEQAEGDLKQSLALETSTEQTITLDVEQQMAAQKEAYERIDISAKAVEQAQLALVLARERFSLGNGSALEMSDSELSLENAKISRIQALCDYKIAQARLKRAMGVLEVTQ